jgi:predicted Zn-dependent protease
MKPLRYAAIIRACLFKSFVLKPSSSPSCPNRSRYLAALLVVALLQPVHSVGQGSASLPQLGDGEQMSIAAEKKLGVRIARELYRDPDYIDDPLISGYVQRIWQPLLAAARKRGEIAPEQADLAWEVMMGKDRTINAFALPGAYFGLHLGLVASVATRDELASVLAHELTHVSQRHIARQIGRQNQQAPWLLAAAILGAMAASKNPQAASAVITGSQAVGAQAQLNFSRDMEREADRIGFIVMQEAGFDVRGFVGMFDKLQAANRINDNGSFPYLRTHPLTTERIGDMQARLQLQSFPALDATGQRARWPAMVEHAVMATRARIFSDGAVDSLRGEMTQAAQALRSVNAPGQASAPVPQRIKELAHLYGGAMAGLKQRDLMAAQRYAQAAREQALQLRSEMPFNAMAGMESAQTAIELIATEIAMAGPANAENLQAAKAAIEAARALPSQRNDRAVLLMWAQQQARAARANAASAADIAAATDALQLRASAVPSDALAWEALAMLQETQGQTLRSLRSIAESRVAVLDYGAALDRLKAAQEWARRNGANHVDASIIDTRTRNVQAMVRELQLERDKP